jgi:hypothetical protein
VTTHSLTASRRASWLPPVPLINAKLLELRKRRIPAGAPNAFATAGTLMDEFGFIAAVALGATAGAADLSDGMFRHLVITGRSRLALYLARIPAGLSILLSLAAAGFTAACLVTAFLNPGTSRSRAALFPSTASASSSPSPWTS